MQISKPALVLAGLLLVSVGAAADNGKHGLSAFGELKYPADFKHFEWVNPDAPKGGRLSMIGTAALTTFDSFNNFILKGDAAQGLDFLFESLMVRAQDEPDAVYGLVAKSADVAPDGLSVTFKLRPEAKFADGTPLTAADVARYRKPPTFTSKGGKVAQPDPNAKPNIRFVFPPEWQKKGEALYRMDDEELCALFTNTAPPAPKRKAG